MECWIRLAPEGLTAARHSIIKRIENQSCVLWELYLASDGKNLCFQFGQHHIHPRSLSKEEDEEVTGYSSAVYYDRWTHIAFTLHWVDLEQVQIQLALDGKLIHQETIENHSEKPHRTSASELIMGENTSGLEFTEIRIWAKARSIDDLYDMKDNYLNVAEKKRKLKVSIHPVRYGQIKCIS